MRSLILMLLAATNLMGCVLPPPGGYSGASNYPPYNAYNSGAAKTEWVNGYYRDGRWVDGYWRSPGDDAPSPSRWSASNAPQGALRAMEQNEERRRYDQWIELERQRIAAGVPVASSGSEKHWIKTASRDGSVIVLEDESVWEVAYTSRIDVSLWMELDDVVIVDDAKLVNLDQDEIAEVRRVR